MRTKLTNTFALITLIFLFIPTSVFSAKNIISVSDKKHTVSGYIKDGTTGENLPGATVYIKESGTGVAANSYGFYSISLKPGVYHVVYTFWGFTNCFLIINSKYNS